MGLALRCVTCGGIFGAGKYSVGNRSEKTLSIHSIYTSRREAFCWAAVLATFALGTATGDRLVAPTGVGFGG